MLILKNFADSIHNNVAQRKKNNVTSYFKLLKIRPKNINEILLIIWFRQIDFWLK